MIKFFSFLISIDLPRIINSEKSALKLASIGVKLGLCSIIKLPLVVEYTFTDFAKIQSVSIKYGEFSKSLKPPPLIDLVLTPVSGFKKLITEPSVTIKFFPSLLNCISLIPSDILICRIVFPETASTTNMFLNSPPINTSLVFGRLQIDVKSFSKALATKKSNSPTNSKIVLFIFLLIYDTNVMLQSHIFVIQKDDFVITSWFSSKNKKNSHICRKYI